MACVHVLDPLERGTLLERIAEPPKLGGALVRVNLDVRELRRHDDETKDRGGRQIRHGERLTDEIAARADVSLELVERRAHLLARLPDGLRPDAEASLHDLAEPGSERLEQTDSPTVGTVEQREERLRLRQVVVEQHPPRVGTALLVEVVLQLERAAALLRIGRVERRL